MVSPMERANSPSADFLMRKVPWFFPRNKFSAVARSACGKNQVASLWWGRSDKVESYEEAKLFGEIEELKLQRGFDPTPPTLELAPAPLTTLLSLLKNQGCHFDFKDYHIYRWILFVFKIDRIYVNCEIQIFCPHSF